MSITVIDFKALAQLDEEFTPGPWIVDQDPEHYGPDEAHIVSASGVLIAEMNYVVRHGRDRPKYPLVDAKLIAQVPDMYSLVRDLAMNYDHYEDDHKLYGKCPICYAEDIFKEVTK